MGGYLEPYKGVPMRIQGHFKLITGISRAFPMGLWMIQRRFEPEFQERFKLCSRSVERVQETVKDVPMGFRGSTNGLR